MATEISNWEIIKRCEEWLNCTREERWDVNGKAVAKVGNALNHIATLVLCDMKFLAQMGDAGLGHGAGPQVRRLLEISTVVSDMQEHGDKAIADAVFAAWQENRSLPPKLISRSRKRLKGENGKIAKNIEGIWDLYNSESHFNLSERMHANEGPKRVWHGIAAGYIVINALALYREKYLADDSRIQSTRRAESLLDECGSAFLEQLKRLGQSRG